MGELLTDAAIALFESFFGYEWGTDYFFGMLAATFGAFFISGYFFSTLFGRASKRIGSALALILPLISGVAFYAVTMVYAVPKVEADWAPIVIPWMSFGFGTTVVIFLISKEILRVNYISLVLIFFMASFMSSIAYYGADLLFQMKIRSDDSVNASEDFLEQ